MFKKIPLIFCLMLSACGGGGDSATITTVPTVPQVQIDPNMTVPLQTALSNIVKDGINKNFSISGFTSSVNKYPLTGSGTLTTGSASSATLNSQAVLKAVQIITQSVTVNGSTSTSTSSTTQYFKPSDYTKVADETATLFNQYAAYTVPTTVKAGDTGNLSSYVTYDSATKIVAPGSRQSKITYLVQKDSTSTLLIQLINDTYGDSCSAIDESNSGQPVMCFRSTNPDLVYKTHSTQAITTYRISTTGQISPVTVELSLFNTSGAVAQKQILTF